MNNQEWSQIGVGSELQYDVQQPTTFLFKISAGLTDNQRVVNEDLSFSPGLNVENYQVGPEGNRTQRVLVQPCQLKVRYTATVELRPEIERPAEVIESNAADIPADVLTYMNPSRYCESDLLGRFAFEEFGSLQRGFSRAQAICDWVFNHLDYSPGSTGPTTTASDVLLQRTGVCRDYAHLMIALCRGIGMPARYLAGYAVDLQPPDFHGFVEVYLDGNWYLFDPTRLAAPRSLVRISAGRDAADVAFSTITGSATLQSKSVWANFVESIPPLNQGDAVSIS